MNILFFVLVILCICLQFAGLATLIAFLENLKKNIVSPVQLLLAIAYFIASINLGVIIMALTIPPRFIGGQ